MKESKKEFIRRKATKRNQVSEERENKREQERKSKRGIEKE